VFTEGFSYAVVCGVKITESTLVKSLGISNGPVREALFRLQQEGWIRTVGNKGSFLVDFSDPEIARQIYLFRQCFESGTFYSLAGSVTPEQTDVLRQILETMKTAGKESNSVSYRKADLKFHLQAAEFAIGPAYAQLFRPKLMQSFAVAFHVLTKAGRTERERYRQNLDVLSHQDLLAALVARDSKQAARLITSHCSHVAHLVGIENRSSDETATDDEKCNLIENKRDKNEPESIYTH
jgi:DNA-binding GntR family transcriptional regulator